jgi:ferredoxin
MKRKIIEINEELCNGCGACLPNCPEGALQLIDGKVRLVSDRFCDGLGACIGECPLGAIKVVEREAEPYDEVIVMAKIATQGANTIKAHLKHLREHNEDDLLAQAIGYLKENNIAIPEDKEAQPTSPCACSGSPEPEPEPEKCGCPGGMSRVFDRSEAAAPQESSTQVRASSLTHWPVQLQLVNPDAPFLEGADLLVCADCVPFALNGFHETMLAGKTLVVFCPKLDECHETYIEKLTAMFTRKHIKSITAVRMEVPCCGGIEYMIKEALNRSGADIPFERLVVTLDGKIAD